MEHHIVSKSKIEQFQISLTEQEKSDATIQKYVREIYELKRYLSNRPITKAIMIDYRKFFAGAP